MPQPQRTDGSRFARRVAARVALSYLVFGLAWIIFSDHLVLRAVGGDVQRLAQLQTSKGVVYVGLSALLIFVLLFVVLRREQASLRRLAASERRFRGVFESDLIGLFFADRDGHILGGNRRFVEFLGYDEARMASRSVRWRDITPPEYFEIDSVNESEVIRNGACRPYEKELIAMDGRRVPVLVGAAIVDESEGVAVGFLIDISRQKQAEQHIRDLNEELRRANQVKDEFLAMMSHELRTPITAIRLWLDVLARGCERRDHDCVNEAAEMIRVSAIQQSELIEDLLDVSRIMVNKLVLNQTTARLSEIVLSAVAAHSPAAAEAGVQLDFSHDQDERFVHADVRRLRQAVSNLVANGIKFTPRGGRVEVTLRHHADRAEVVVRDNGVGIDPQFLPRLFERFRQADTSTTRRHGGMGIGLWLTRNLLERHGGTVVGESEGPGRGAKFTITLPLLPQGTVDRDSPATAEMAEPSLAEVSVLVVEDDPQGREGLRRVLEGLGGRVTAVADVAAALRHLDTERCDVLIADVAMPSEGGESLIRRLRQMPDARRRELPAIALTAHALPEDRERALNSGFDRYVVKPIDPETLAREIRMLLATRGSISPAAPPG